MKTSVITILLTGTLLFANTCKGEWYIGEFNTSSQPQLNKIKNLDDTEQLVTYKGIPCLISKTNFTRSEGDLISEFRSMECDVGNEIVVQELVSCHKPLVMISKFSLRIKGKFFSPVLVCDYRIN